MHMRLGSVVGIDGSESYFYESDLDVSWYDMNTPETIRTLLESHDVSAQISVTFELH